VYRPELQTEEKFLTVSLGNFELRMITIFTQVFVLYVFKTKKLFMLRFTAVLMYHKLTLSRNFIFVGELSCYT